MVSETDKRSPRRRPSDLYGGIATVAESGLLISPTSEWDLKQRRVWPPTPCQAYCEKHFLQECLVYYSLEVERIMEEDEKDENKNKSKSNNKKKENQATREEPKTSLPSLTTHSTPRVARQQPTRIQPGRRAKGSSAAFPSPSSASTAPGRMEILGNHGPPSSRRRIHRELSAAEHERMERRQELGLDLPWAEFHGRVEGLIQLTHKKLRRHNTQADKKKNKKKYSPHTARAAAGMKRKKNTSSSPNEHGEEEEEKRRPSLDYAAADDCPLQGLIKVECRYCQHRPEINGGGDDDDDDDDIDVVRPPSRRAPVAPMHKLEAADFGPGQICTFGGLTFAVDACGGGGGGTDAVTVVLLEMKSLDPQREPKGHEDGDGAGEEEQDDDDDDDDNLSSRTHKPPAAIERSKKRARTGKRQEAEDKDLNWMPEEET